MVPVAELVTMAAIRLTTDERKEAYKADAISRAKQIDALGRAFDAQGEELENTKEQKKQLLHELGVVNARANTAERKVKKRRKWIYVGLAGLVYVGLDQYNHLK